MSEQDNAIEALKAVFQKVTQENLEKARLCVENLSGDDGAVDNMHDMYRSMHDLKGQAGAFSYPVMSDMAAYFCAYLRKCGVVEKAVDAKDRVDVLHLRFFVNALKEAFDLGGEEFPPGWGDFIDDLKESEAL